VPVVDAAFEAAVLPWATAPRPGPANLAVGLGDRHLGWLGDLAEMAALLRGSLAWEQSIALSEGDVDADLDLGRTMSADALRWAAYTGLTPERAESEFLRPLWQLVVANLSPKDGERSEQNGKNALLDRWQRARLYQAIDAVTKALDASDPRLAAEEVSALVRDLSYWCTFKGFADNHALLGALVRLLAPFAPHLAEAIYRQAGSRSGKSVHLADWPGLDPSWADPALLVGLVQVQQLAALGQAARAQAGIEPDQRLQKAMASSLGAQPSVGAEFEDVLADALGVTRVEIAAEAATQVTWRLSLASPQTSDDKINAALASLSPEATVTLVQQIQEGLSIGLDVKDQAVTLLPGEIRVTPEAPPGWVAAADTDYLILLRVG
jgi:isoleucyl-tRNA synthetase